MITVNHVIPYLILSAYHYYRICREEVQPFAETLLVNLFSAFSLPGSNENEYIMKGMVRLWWKCGMDRNDMSQFINGS